MKTPSWQRRGDGYYPGWLGSHWHAATHDRMLLLNVRKGNEPKHDPSAVVRAGKLVTNSGLDVETAALAEGMPEKDLSKMWKGKKG